MEQSIPVPRAGARQVSLVVVGSGVKTRKLVSIIMNGLMTAAAVLAAPPR